jgi:hypothetical protein
LCPCAEVQLHDRIARKLLLPGPFDTLVENSGIEEERHGARSPGALLVLAGRHK